MILFQIIKKYIYLIKDTHETASKKLCSKIIFEIRAVKGTETSTYADKYFYGEKFTVIKKHA